MTDTNAPAGENDAPRRAYVRRAFLENEITGFRKRARLGQGLTWIFAVGAAALTATGEMAGAVLSLGGSALAHRFAHVNKVNGRALRDYVDRHTGDLVPYEPS